MRRRVQILGWTLIWSGTLIFGYVGFQLFGTDLINGGAQAEAEERLEVSLAGEAPSPETIDTTDYLGTVDPPALDAPEQVDFFAEAPPEQGTEFAFLRIPKIDLDEVLFEGVDRETLKNGPGHMAGTPLPGQPGNAVLSGHRTTYGRPFFDFDLLELGDQIEVETEVGVHVYEVREMQVVLPHDVWVTHDRPGGWLTLTTCNPKFSARERLVVWAEMVSGPNYQFIKLHEARFGA